VRTEAHEFSIVLEVASDVGQIDAAAYLKAYSSSRWMSASIGSVWRDFKGLARSFFKSGLPVEAYGEWSNITRV
jgi:hypothetical protein